MRIGFAGLACLGLLAGCGEQAQKSAQVSDAAGENPYGLVGGGPSPEVSTAPRKAAAPAPDAQLRTGAALIAYSYDARLQIPAERLDAVQRGHIAACATLGPARCQLLGSTRTELSQDAVEATLDLRIAPLDAKPFLDRLQTSAAGAGGRVLSTNMTGEDLTRELIDAEAALRAKRTLRDRLQTLLEQRQGNLADLLAVERELAQTQQALDTATALLAELRQRVVFSRLSVAYRSERPLTGLDGDRPFAAAMARAGQTFSTSLAALLTLAVAALPWALPIGAAVWLARRARRKRAV